ncbi:MAG: cysteine--tRNA ligase [Candidatus Taylorbacteria bacterium]
MQITLFNTLSKNKEIFKPLKIGKVGMYNCGPTVYDHAHIGNMRAYIFADTLRRMFEYNGYHVNQIMNITDVGHLSGENAGNADEGEDKMTKALKREGMPLTLDAMYKVATIYFDKFVEDIRDLNIELPSKFPRAADHIKEDLELIADLSAKGFTYNTSDGVYFDTSKFAGYGKLGNIDIASLRAGARVTENTEKRNPTDFALWKFSKQADVSGSPLGWDSPWGNGFPGWHIECSAMSTKYLGQPFDVHTGGIDHIPVHHNNEIAQSEAAHGKPLANYWMHNGFINVDSKKMSKSAGGFATMDLLKKEGVSPIAYRYWLLTAHYRSPANFTYEAVRGAESALSRLVATLRDYPSGGKIIAEYKEKFTAFINDDLDTPKAIALIWDLLKDSTSKISPADKLATILDFDKVLGLRLADEKKPTVVPTEIVALAEAREKARLAKDWKKADTLRGQIEAAGFDILDNKAGGYELRKSS